MSLTCCAHCILFRDFCILVPPYARLAYVSELHFLSNSLHPLRCPCFSFSYLKQVPSSPSSSSQHLPGWPANLNEKRLQQHSLCHCKLRKVFPSSLRTKKNQDKKLYLFILFLSSHHRILPQCHNLFFSRLVLDVLYDSFCGETHLQFNRPAMWWLRIFRLNSLLS